MVKQPLDLKKNNKTQTNNDTWCSYLFGRYIFLKKNRTTVQNRCGVPAVAVFIFRAAPVEPSGLPLPILRCGRSADAKRCCFTTVDGNPAPVDRWFIPLFIGFQHVSTIQGGAGFRNHPTYVSLVSNFKMLDLGVDNFLQCNSYSIL